MSIRALPPGRKATTWMDIDAMVEAAARGLMDAHDAEMMEIYAKRHRAYIVDHRPENFGAAEIWKARNFGR